jgi:hypothetical protein
VNTLLADPPPAPVEPPAASPATEAAPAEAPAPVGAQGGCANCGSPMLASQDWCLQCGAGAPGSLGSAGAGWGSLAVILTATVLLVLGAAAAGYAALSKGTTHKPKAVAQNTTPLSGTPSTPAITPPTIATPKTIGTPKTLKPATPLATVKPPKIPLTVATPKIPAITTPTITTPTTTSTPTTETGGSTTTTTKTPPPEPILLDTNAAETYNPKEYPVSTFGDPTLVIDGETSTGWTAQVDPTIAPKMAAGLVFNLKAAQKVSSLKLITTAPGITVQVFGSNSKTLPKTIGDPAWSKLSQSVVVKTRHFEIKLKSTTAFRLLTLWISKVPTASVGTVKAPGHVAINEVELFPAP